MPTPELTREVTQATEWRRYLDQNLAVADTGNPAINVPVVTTTPNPRLIQLNGYKGFSVLPFGDTDDATITMSFIFVEKVALPFKATVQYIERFYLDRTLIRVGDVTGDARGLLRDDERLCSDLGAATAENEAAWVTDFELAYGTVGAAPYQGNGTIHAAADGTGTDVMQIWFPECGSAFGFYIRFTAISAGAVNCLYRLETRHDLT
jgi:hypothetical protein